MLAIGAGPLNLALTTGSAQVLLAPLAQQGPIQAQQVSAVAISAMRSEMHVLCRIRVSRGHQMRVRRRTYTRFADEIAASTTRSGSRAAGGIAAVCRDQTFWPGTLGQISSPFSSWRGTAKPVSRSALRCSVPVLSESHTFQTTMELLGSSGFRYAGM